MLKQSLMALGIAAIASTSMMAAGDAEAGHRKFKKFHGHFHHYHGHYGYKGCWYYKKKFYRTGYKFWLKKYHRCKYGWY